MNMNDLQNDLAPFWMPFTANRQFKQAPRLLSEAKGMYYKTPDGREILDGTAGLWCVAAGHCRDEIVAAVRDQVGRMDFAPTFNMGHPVAFETASRLAAITPPGLNRIFFTNSGSESADTAMKIALAYHRARGDTSRTRFIGRERAYHGVNFGGMSVGGIPGNRKMFGSSMLPGVDHLRATHDIERNAFSKGQPAHGAEFADELERLVALHDASNIAAVIVEPLCGSAGVLVPPKGYLERLRSICDKHGILLIFDEVITGFGRLGGAFAYDVFGVKPDLMTMAKAINNATIPMGAVAVKQEVHDAVINATPEGGIEFAHGYTYSAHPVACAAANATLALYEKERLFERAGKMAPFFEAAAHALKGTKHVIDIRNYGLVAGIEMQPRTGAVGKRGYEALVGCFEKGLMVRATGDTIAVSPPLIVEEAQIERIFSTIAEVIKSID
ncbi:MAG TPA: aspartate aminotransferase family protein [Burkholderiales bacterium]|nr:aspartate aminotransferase family protein [Burkholderiales bacterium]